MAAMFFVFGARVHSICQTQTKDDAYARISRIRYSLNKTFSFWCRQFPIKLLPYFTQLLCVKTCIIRVLSVQQGSRRFECEDLVLNICVKCVSFFLTIFTLEIHSHKTGDRSIKLLSSCNEFLSVSSTLSPMLLIIPRQNGAARRKCSCAQ
ncbi:hypothetical protein EBF16_26440 [Sphingobium yanoikuyae]|uniref:Uncharacterized protein n=1 Tax=Sphingobium yanoikuyae TaxID=13690 RepID=A0A3G2UY53_SPHYA|nr:hypothetical protein EBF16_26440 [Sphingobium yanoikuyae]